MIFVQVEKEIGEKRVISFHGTGISVAPKINFREIADACPDPEDVGYIYNFIYIYIIKHEQGFGWSMKLPFTLQKLQ